jgi:hypothetical protein
MYDKITKEKIITFETRVYQTNLGDQLFSTSGEKIIVVFGKMGNKTLIQVSLYKSQNSAENAALETKCIAEVGKEMVFGFGDRAAITMTVAEVQNQTKMDKVSGHLPVTETTLVYYLSDADLPIFREAFDNHLVDGIRLNLANGVVYEQSIKDAPSRELQEKAKCFFHLN